MLTKPIADAEKTARKTNFLREKDDEGTVITNAAEAAGAIQKKLRIRPLLDEQTSATTVKVVLGHIPSLAGIERIDVLAVNADEAKQAKGDIAKNNNVLDALADDDTKSVLLSKAKPKSDETVILENIKAPETGSNTGKVQIYYRLHDINGIISHWITAGEVVPKTLDEDISNLAGKEATERIREITWTPVDGYKTIIEVEHADTGRMVASHTFDAGIDAVVFEIEIYKALASLFVLYGGGTYKILAKAKKDDVVTQGIETDIEVSDTIGPSGNKGRDFMNPIILSIEKIGGRMLRVSLDKEPYESDYAKTKITVLLKETGSATATEAKSYTSITFPKGKTSHIFEGTRDGDYSAAAVFYDRRGNASEKADDSELYTIMSKESVTLADSDEPPLVTSVVISTVTATPSIFTDGTVEVKWTFDDSDDSKFSHLVKELTITPLQYDDVDDEEATRLPSKTVNRQSKTVKGSEYKKVTFYDLPVGKEYEFEVKGKDIFDMAIAAQKNNKRVSLSVKTPANIASGGANIEVPSDITGTLQFTKGNSLAEGKHTTHIQVTLKKDGSIVKEYNESLFAADTTINPLAPGTYTAELRSYSSDTGKVSSKVKTVNELTVVDGSDAPTTAVSVDSEEKYATKFVVKIAALDERTGIKKADIFGKHYDASPLSDAMFVLYYVRQKYTKNGVTVSNTTDATKILKVVESVTHNKEDAGKIDIYSKAGLGEIEVADLTKQATYRYFIRTINKIDTTKYIDGAARTVTLPSSPVVQDPVVTAVSGKNAIKVRVPETIDFGSAADGTDLERSTVRYFFYYVRDGYIEGDITVNSDTTVNEIMGFGYSGSADAERGKIALAVDNGVGTDKEVGGLLANTQYYCFVRVEEKADNNNGTNSEVKNGIAGSGVVAVNSVPVPSVVTAAATGFTTGNIAGAVVTSAKKANGDPAEASDVEYVLYYAASPTALTAAQIKAGAQSTSATTGKEEATVGQPITVSGKTFIAGTTVYIVVEARIKSDSTRTTLSPVASYHVSDPPTVVFGGGAKTYKKGDKIQVMVMYVSAITVMGKPKIKIKVGANNRDAEYTRVDDFNELIFEYTVKADDEDANGIEIEKGEIDLNGGTINHRDMNKTEASLAHTAVGPDAMRTVDGIAPKVASVAFEGTAPFSGIYKTGEKIQVKVTFNEVVKVTGVPKIKITVGTAEKDALYVRGASTKIDLIFEYTVGSGDTDLDGIEIKEDALTLNSSDVNSITIEDSAGNAAILTHEAVPLDKNRKVDGVVPTVQSIAFEGAVSGGVYGKGDIIQVKVTFNEVVKVTGKPKIKITVGEVEKDALYANGGDSTELIFAYTVKAGDIDTDGIEIKEDALTLNSSDATNITIKDSTGNAAILSHVAVPLDENRKVDGVVPEVKSVAFEGRASGGVYRKGDIIRVKVIFSKVVKVTGKPKIKITVGEVDKDALYASGGDSTDLIFTYTVEAGDTDTNGIEIKENVLTLNSSDANSITIEDSAGNAAILSHTAVGKDAERVVDTALRVASVVFEGTAPSSGAYKAGEKIRVKVSFFEIVVVTGKPKIKITVGEVDKDALYASGGDSTDLIFTYTVKAGDTDTNGIEIKENVLTLNSSDATSGTIENKAGNAAILTHEAVPPDARREVDGVVPTVKSVAFEGAVSGGVYGKGDIIQVKVRFSEVVVVTGKPKIKITVGEVDKDALYANGGDSTALIFAYTVESGDTDAEGIKIKKNVLTLNSSDTTSGTIEDKAGNAAVLTYEAVSRDAEYKVDTALRVKSVTFKDTVLSGKVYEAGDVIRVKVSFSEEVAVEGTPKIGIVVGANNREAEYANGDGSTELIFKYTVGKEDADADIESIAIKENSLELNGGTIKDKAGDDIRAAATTFLAVTFKFGKSSAFVINALEGNVLDKGTISKYPDTATGTFSIDPELPAGLAIDEDTGEISGTPTTATVTKDSDDEYTVTFTGTGGFTNATTKIIVRVYKRKPANKEELKTVIATEINSQGNEADLNNIDTSAIKDMSKLFQEKQSFNGHVSKWDVSQVEDMKFMFNNAKAFNRDISGWDVSQVTNMQKMFYQAYAFKQNLSKWNVDTSTTKTDRMFDGSGTTKPTCWEDSLEACPPRTPK